VSSIDEKRVYADQTGTVTAYVAADLGVAAVSVSADIVGEFSLVERTSARDVAATARGVAIATDDGVLLGDGETFERVGVATDATMESATAVTDLDGDVLAADADGRVARYDGEWTGLGTCGEVRALDGDLVAAANGVYRVTGDALQPVGLDDVRDVASAGVPHAATSDGLFRLGNGWMDAVGGAFEVVDAATIRPADAESAADNQESTLVAHAATADALYEHAGGQRSPSNRTQSDDANGDWRERRLPVEERVAGVAYGPGVVLAVTEAGTILADAGDGFRHRALGLQGTRAVAVVADD
jgi:hypothetical protein